MNKKTPGKKSKKAVLRPKIVPKAKLEEKSKPKAAIKSKPKPKDKMGPKANSRPKPTLKSKPNPKAIAKQPPAKLKVNEPREGRGSRREPELEDVMSSLLKIFSGKEFQSDAELDAFLEDNIAKGIIPPSAALDPLDEAQSLIYEAWNTEGREKVHLAKRALDLSKDCSDAYIILAEEEAKTLPMALELYRQGRDAAIRTLDPEIFKNGVGHFWGIMETRPYMRATLGLAKCLWELGQQEEAVEHLRNLLRLNPNDNQGNRYVLIEYLMELDADEELGELLKTYRDDATPEICYTHALWVYRHEGRSKSASTLLAQAIRNNPHVPEFLLNRKKIPKFIPDALTVGSAEEAAAYASESIEHWQHTLGALEWLSLHLAH